MGKNLMKNNETEEQKSPQLQDVKVEEQKTWDFNEAKAEGRKPSHINEAKAQDPVRVFFRWMKEDRKFRFKVLITAALIGLIALPTLSGVVRSVLIGAWNMPAQTEDPSAENGWNTAYYKKLANSIPEGMAGEIPLSLRMWWLFPDGVPEDEVGMRRMMVTVTVPLYQEDGSTKDAEITCHPRLATEIAAIFEEMKEAKFPISQVGCYGYRHMNNGTGTHALSHHSYGVCVDLNWDVNPHVSWGTTPDETSPYYISQEVVDIWKKHGFYWGGDWGEPYTDWMHFTYTDH